MASFPLRCSICPKDPTFSDVSHLLTHVASKGHLSHYFRAQVRSRQDFNVHQKLQDYDIWYLENNIEDLLSQRLMQKDSKRGINKGVKLSGVTLKTRKSSMKRDGAEVSIHSIPASGDAAIDPCLPQISLQSGPSSTIPLTPVVNPRMRARRANMGQSYDWEAGLLDPKLSSPSRQDRRYQQLTRHNISGYDGDGNEHQLSDSTKLEFLEFLPQRQSPSPSVHKPEYSYHSPATTRTDFGLFDDNIFNEDDECAESSRLKGVVWPGMDLFDSASPEAKRKRNQRKDSSVLALMQTNAGLVEPTETIYFPSWEMKQERFISGEVESSPLKDEDSPKPRRNRCRPNKFPLMDLDKNAPCFEKKPKGRKPLQKKQKTQEKKAETKNSTDIAKDSLQPLQAKSKHRTRAQQEEDPDWLLTTGRQNVKKKDKLKIFNDKVENTVTCATSSKPQSRIVANGRSQDQVHTQLKVARTRRCVLGNWKDHDSGVAPTSEHMLRPTSENVPKNQCSQKSTARQVDGKENIEPVVDQHGRIDSSFSHGFGHSTQRYFAMRNDEPPSFYQEMPPFMDYDSVPGLNGFRQIANPLATTRGGQTTDSDSPRFLPAPNLPLTPRYGMESDNMEFKADFEESSGDETIDQSLGGCLDFFDT